MSFRDLIRIVIIKTNSIWPFTFLNRFPYHLALKGFIYKFRSFKEVKSIYLRHGMSRKNWVPAVSDIDLTVIIDGNLSVKEEYNFLKVFWKKFGSLKKIFPMLGEVDILNENEIESWTRYTIRGHEAGKWKLLYGKGDIKSSYKVDQDTLAVDSINYALTNYLEYFIPKFYSSQQNDFIVYTELSRLVSKILRYISPLSDANIIKSNNSVSQMRSELLYNILKGFELSINSLKVPVSQVNSNFNSLMLMKEEGYDHEFEMDKINLEALDECLNKIDAFIVSYTAKIIILKDGISSLEAISCFDTIRKAFSGYKIKPVILSFTLFEYYLKIYNPFIFSELLESRKVIFGKDLFLKVKQPDYYFYRKSLIDETGNVLLFPHSSSLFRRKSIRNYVQNGFNSKTNKVLFLKLYLEKSTVEPSFNKCLEECKKFYPQYITQINHLISNYENISDDQLSFDTYKLLETLSSEIK